MDKKYVSKTVALPETTHQILIRMQEELTKRLGFKPSISETIAAAATRWIAEEMN